MAKPVIHKLKALSVYGFPIAVCGKTTRTNMVTSLDYEVTCPSCIERIGYIQPRRILNKENR